VTRIWQNSGMDLNSCVIYNVLAEMSVPKDADKRGWNKINHQET